MFRQISIFILSFCFMFSSAAFAKQRALPKRIQANYEVTKNGQPFAKVQEQYVVTGNSYKIESTTKGIGVYALFGVRTLTSTGKLTKQGLKPMHFELHQGENPKKALFTDFDWPNKTLHMLVKGSTQDAVLSAGTQDLASFAYQFMFLPRPLKNVISVTLTTGKKLNHYQYQINPGLELLKVAGAQYKTVHLIPTDQSKDQIETKELWLAADYNYLLVRFLMVDEDGAKLEQTLSELHVE